jgi:hypothetical protein
MLYSCSLHLLFLFQRKLEKSPNTAVINAMNAAEIIDEIQRLPGNEQGKVVEFVRHLPNAETIINLLPDPKYLLSLVESLGFLTDYKP